MAKFDIVVVGGGPAGSATALSSVRCGMSVALIESSDYAGTRVGETLPPATRKLLITLGVWDRFVADNHSPSFGIRSAWGDHNARENDFIFSPYGSGWHVDRNRFDRMLAMAAEDAGANVFLGAKLVSLANTESRKWKITIDSGQKRIELVSAFLVDATGRRSFVARKQGAIRISYDRLIALVGFMSPKPRSLVEDSFTLVESQADGWWYSAVLPDRRLVAAYMTDSDFCAPDHERVNFWRGQLRKSRHTLSRAKGYSLQSGLTKFAANSSRLDRIVGDGWLAVGDAAAAFDPLSSQGIYKALESGLCGAQAIVDDQETRKTALSSYVRSIADEFDDYLRIRDKYYDKERRWPSSVFWARRRSNLQA